MSDAQKLHVALSLLATGRMVRVVFRPDSVDVVVPEQYRTPSPMSLDFGRQAPTPIDDLKCDASGISGTLRFGEDYFRCLVPWGAVVMIKAHGPTPTVRAWNPVMLDGGKN